MMSSAVDTAREETKRMRQPSLPDPVPPGRTLRCAFISAEFKHNPGWPWLSSVPPLSEWPFTRRAIRNTWKRVPKLSKPYRWMQYRQAARATRDADVVFLFSYDVAIGMNGPFGWGRGAPKRVYVGFHQDQPLAPERIEAIGRAIRPCEFVTVLTDAEREIYIARYGLQGHRVVTVPIHTDHADGYDKYSETSPEAAPYALAMGSPNRIFKPTAEASRALGIPLVIITRPWHKNDNLEELRALGVKVITDADMMKALTYLKHARINVMDYERDEYASGFITIVHSMFLRTPIVSSDCLGVPEHVVTGQTGLLVPHGDAAALHEAIGRLWSDDALVERFAEAGWRRAQQRHSLEAGAQAFHDLALRAVGQRS